MKHVLTPTVILIFSLLFYAAVWLLIVAIDILNFHNLSGRLASADIDFPLVWVHMFREAGPVEMVVWVFLSLSSLFLAVIAGYRFGKGGAFCSLFVVVFRSRVDGD